jgi:polyhydroxyalkanoate synthesis repressor PhaR
MRKIKKYANRKLYDTVDKQYISMDHLAQLVKAGEAVVIIDNQTDQDITVSILSQLLAKEKKGSESEELTDLLSGLIRKGGDTVMGYAKKYSSRWQGAVSVAEDEIEKLSKIFFKGRDIGEEEQTSIKKELLGHANGLKDWISHKVDQRVNAVLSMMSLATREDIKNLIADVVALERRLTAIEEKIDPPSASAEAIPGDEEV